MSGKSAILIALGVALSIAGALAAQPPPEAQKERLVCRGGGAKTLGSHIRARRRCRTAEQWRQEDQEKAGLPLPLQVTEGQNDGHGPAQPR